MDKKAVIEAFMQAWIDQDFGKMFDLSQKTWQDNNDLDKLTLLYEPFKLKAFNIFSSTFVSNASHKFNIDLTMDNGARVICQANVICEVAPFKPAAFGDWGVNPASVQKAVANIPAKASKEGKKAKPDAKK